ncbi:MAG: type II secretion system protein [Phycisphaerales bacterium]|nr:type II secretion system protein [Phycisphaerales bacterium]
MRREGFTLIELLVVIAIIAILLAMMLPALSKSKMASQMTVCTANQSQLNKANIQYMNDNKDVVADPGWLSKMKPVNKKYASWLYKGNAAGGPDQVIKDKLGASTGTFWPYLSGEPGQANGAIQKVYRCPSHKAPFKGPYTTDNLTSYLMNGGVIGYGYQGPNGKMYFSSFRADRFRPDVILLWEAWTKSSFNDSSSYPHEDRLTDRHGPGATVALLDGSCRWMSRVLYDEELAKEPGRLWCSPVRKNGGD